MMQISITLLLTLSFIACSFVIACILLHQYEHPHATSGIHVDTPTGWVGVAGAAVIWGFYNIAVKSPALVQEKIDPMIFQCYFSGGVVLVSFVLFLVNLDSVEFTLWGVVGGSIWVFQQTMCYFAIQGAGLTLAPPIWSGITVIVSFVCGAAILDESVRDVTGSAISLVIIVVGIILVSWTCSKSFAARFGGRSQRVILEIDPEEPLIKPSAEFDHKEVSLEDDEQPSIAEISGSEISLRAGIIGAVITGLLNGVSLLPFSYYAQSTSIADPSISYLVSYAVGISTSTVLFFMLWFYFPPREEILMEFKVRITIGPGLFTGFCWACGNICVTYGTACLGQTIGFPLSQLAICFMGIWGIVLYKEIEGCRVICCFLLSVAVILCGCTLLPIFVH